MVVLIDAEAPDPQHWLSHARFLVSGWSRSNLKNASDALSKLDELTSLGQERDHEGDIVLTVTLRRLTAEADAILEHISPDRVRLTIQPDLPPE